MLIGQKLQKPNVQSFSLIALLLTVVLGAWLLPGGFNSPAIETENGKEQQEVYGNYFDAIDAAEDAAEAIFG